MKFVRKMKGNLHFMHVACENGVTVSRKASLESCSREGNGTFLSLRGFVLTRTILHVTNVKCPALFRCPLLRINIFMHHACVCSLCIRGEHKAFGATTYHDGRATPTETFENINSHSRLFQLVQIEKCGRTIQELNWQVRRPTELRKRMKTSPSYGRVLHKILNFVISCCRFAESENSKEMYQNL